MSILENINSSNDIKSLDESQLQPLCAELRDFIIENVSKTGGHLASNLGTVELSVALHRVYDSQKDRIVFDVGHQCYTHKIITGRRDSFSSLRQRGGISGFPKPNEAQDDAFIAGHASNSVSVALGMAKARSLKEEDYNVVCVIGDGALTGGLAHEGLINAALSKEPMVIILNDNNMSIDENVGATEKMLQAMRVKVSYVNFKRWYRSTFARFPRLYRVGRKIKDWLKSWLLQSNMFTEMGLEYLGPVDGHDVKYLETVISWAKDLGMPVLLHVMTQKGRGCSYAQEHPEKYHGVGPFDPVSGEILNNGDSFSDVMGEQLCSLAEKDNNIVAITAAMASGTGLDIFAKRFPKRFFDVGITEGHAVSMAAGMAKQGLVPVFAVYSSFLQRSYDMLIHDVSLMNLHAVFCVDRGGIVGSDGETHNGVFDISYLSSVPNMTVLCPASFGELKAMLKSAIYDFSGPVAIRYPRGGEGEYRQVHTQPEELLYQGKDVSIVSYGTMINEAVKAVGLLAERGMEAELIKLSCIKPCNFELCFSSVKKTGRLIVVEDCCSSGSVGSRLCANIVSRGIELKSSALLNLGEGIIPHGKPAELMKEQGIDAEAICKTANILLKKEL